MRGWRKKWPDSEALAFLFWRGDRFVPVPSQIAAAHDSVTFFWQAKGASLNNHQKESWCVAGNQENRPVKNQERKMATLPTIVTGGVARHGSAGPATLGAHSSCRGQGQGSEGDRSEVAETDANRSSSSSPSSPSSRRRRWQE